MRTPRRQRDSAPAIGGAELRELVQGLVEEVIGEIVAAEIKRVLEKIEEQGADLDQILQHSKVSSSYFEASERREAAVDAAFADFVAKVLAAVTALGQKVDDRAHALAERSFDALIGERSEDKNVERQKKTAALAERSKLLAWLRQHAGPPLAMLFGGFVVWLMKLWGWM